jgi:hypothetical protein
LSNVLSDNTLKGGNQIEPGLSEWLSRYTVAVFREKMKRRFNLSMPYIESLKQVKDIPRMSEPMPQPRDPRGLGEVRSDQNFLQDFVMLYVGRLGLDTTITNLKEMAKEMPTDGRPSNDDFQLYTNETRSEFHLLLLELLDRFGKALEELCCLDIDNPGNAEKFKKIVGNVHRNGYALLRLSRGRAFQMHLENIKTLLEDPRRSESGTSFEGHDEEHDEELEAIQAVLPPKGSGGVGKSLSESYVAWLRLMVSRFDAVDILVPYVTSKQFPYNTISIDILLPPPTDSGLLPWSELFRDHKFLPEVGPIGRLSITTNEEILAFLNVGISTAELRKQVSKLLKWWDATSASEYPKKSQLLSQLAVSTDETVKNDAKAILAKFTKWVNLDASDKKRVDIGGEITDAIKALRDGLGELSDSDHFFLNLNNKTFKGTLHCEACLATLLPTFTQGIPPDDSKYKEIEILPRMQVPVEYRLFHLFLSSDPVSCYNRVLDASLEYQNVAAPCVPFFSQP